MPELTNRRQEMFAQYLAKGDCSQATAYELAGYSASASNAAMLAGKPDVKSRIKELRDENERKELDFRVRLAEANLDPDSPVEKRQEVIIWTADEVRRELAQNARLAQVAGQFQAAKESLKLIGDSLGMFEAQGGGKAIGAPGAEKGGPTVNISLLGALREADAETFEPDGHSNPLAPKPVRNKAS